MKVVVFGAGGQLGKCFKKLESQHPDKDFSFVSREDLSITEEEKLRNYLKNISPEIVINCAAYTKVDQAETDKSNCEKVNADAVKNLAELVKQNNSFLIHFSTDYVFDGSKGAPYNEADACKPINFYGESKRRGEEAIIKSDCDYMIFRTSWVYSEFGNNFVKTILRLGSEREEIGIVSDQLGSPTNANDLAEAVMEIIDQGELKKKVGIYHYTNDGKTSWYEFSKEIARIWGLNVKINPIKTVDFPTDAARPLYSVLNKDKITSTTNVVLKYWKDSLKELKNDL